MNNTFISRIVSGTLVLALFLSNGVPTLAASTNNSKLSGSEIISDAAGNTFKLTYSVDSLTPDSASQAALYDSEGTLLQKTYVYPSENRVLEYSYTNFSAYSSNDTASPVSVTEYSYSDLISNIPIEEPSIQNAPGFLQEDTCQYQANVPFPIFNDDEWSYVNHLPPALSSPYSIDLYAMNYDQEPDLHRFEKKSLSLPAKIAITTIAGILAGFITTGGITVATVVRAFGAAIITQGTQQVINKPIKGAVCYSTQKILYAPVVEGYLIYSDAYITKLWLIAENALEGKTTISLAKGDYKFNYMPTQEELMYSARGYFTAWAQGSGYTK